MERNEVIKNCFETLRYSLYVCKTIESRIYDKRMVCIREREDFKSELVDEELKNKRLMAYTVLYLPLVEFLIKTNNITLKEFFDYVYESKITQPEELINMVTDDFEKVFYESEVTNLSRRLSRCLIDNSDEEVIEKVIDKYKNASEVFKEIHAEYDVAEGVLRKNQCFEDVCESNEKIRSLINLENNN